MASEIRRSSEGIGDDGGDGGGSMKPAAIRYRQWKARRTPTAYMARYGTVGIKLLFPAIANHFSISDDAARVRYYRRRIPKAVLNRIRNQLGLNQATGTGRGIVGQGLDTPSKAR